MKFRILIDIRKVHYHPDPKNLDYYKLTANCIVEHTGPKTFGKVPGTFVCYAKSMSECFGMLESFIKPYDDEIAVSEVEGGITNMVEKKKDKLSFTAIGKLFGYNS